jgi:signal transduction histidine kinase
LRTLGDELISSETVALVELVKNAYDADARRVLIAFHEPLEIDAGDIEVVDDGEGMSRDTVLGVWMEPATPNRKQARKSRKKKRAVLGEKGIGRFAAARLARYLDMHTKRSESESQLHVSVDWSQFENEDAYLDEVDISWEETASKEFKKGGRMDGLKGIGGRPQIPRHGTILRARCLNIDWHEDQILELKNGLSRLVSTRSTAKKKDFAIALDLPDRFEHLAGEVEPPETLSKPQYRLTASVKANGHAELEVSREVDGRQRKRTEKNVNLWQEERPPECGPLDIELRVWDRDPESLERLVTKRRSLRDVRADLNAAAGVSVYRDSFRVFPYGEPGNDWLRLDLRRVQNPTRRVSNNQVVGYVHITSKDNPELRDQSNREGLIAGRARDDLELLIRSSIGRLENERQKARDESKDEEDKRQPNPLFDFELTALGKQIRDRHSDDPELIATLEDTERRVAIDVDRVREVVSRYQGLATLGQLIDVVLHDGRTPLSKIGSETDLAIEDNSRSGSETKRRRMVGQRLTFIKNQADALAGVFARIEPFAGRKRGRPKPVSLETVIEAAFDVYESELARLGVEVHLPTSETIVKVNQGEIERVIINLLTNSLHWLATVKGDRKIQVDVSRSGDQVEILFSDSGPGVEKSAATQVFEPYFSTKPEGVGLGLSIAGDIVTEFYAGALELVDGGPLAGATFRIILRHRV